MALIDKLRASRVSAHEVGGITFEVRRPTDLEMFELRGSGSPRRLLPFIVGWKGVREADLITGGDPHPVPFDADLCAEWLPDRADLLWPLVTKVLEAYEAHKASREEAAKN